MPPVEIVPRKRHPIVGSRLAAASFLMPRFLPAEKSRDTGTASLLPVVERKEPRATRMCLDQESSLEVLCQKRFPKTATTYPHSKWMKNFSPSSSSSTFFLQEPQSRFQQDIAILVYRIVSSSSSLSLSFRGSF